MPINYLSYDGRETVPKLDTIQHCLIQSGKCTTNTSIFLWNAAEAISECLYRKIGNYQARICDDLSSLMSCKCHLPLKVTKQFEKLQLYQS
ncbi:unnamed protein product [Dracunculus medinensis]|uniref:Uncharacterized protein n=1 Tax=Dracunculus medinensis TaxID=318479 RepID=A0A0N4U3Z4_DRAME|nr:unnamed protein product [Dracunculus medinensis]